MTIDQTEFLSVPARATITVTGEDLENVAHGDVVRHIGFRSPGAAVVFDSQVYVVDSSWSYVDGSLLGTIDIRFSGGYDLVYSNDGGASWIDSGVDVSFYDPMIVDPVI